jgi:hypothetical protein
MGHDKLSVLKKRKLQQKQLVGVNMGHNIYHKSPRFAQKPKETPMIPRDNRQAPERDLLET